MILLLYDTVYAYTQKRRYGATGLVGTKTLDESKTAQDSPTNNAGDKTGVSEKAIVVIGL